MRAVVSLSMPFAKKKELKAKAKKAKKSLSEYVLWALGLTDEMISEDELVERFKEAEANYKAGKTKKLTSLADLLKEQDDY